MFRRIVYAIDGRMAYIFAALALGGRLWDLHRGEHPQQWLPTGYYWAMTSAAFVAMVLGPVRAPNDMQMRLIAALLAISVWGARALDALVEGPRYVPAFNLLALCGLLTLTVAAPSRVEDVSDPE